MPWTLLFLFDLIGTIAFSISGAAIGLRKNMDIFGVVILGLCTAVGGGVLRDVLAGNTPYILVKHIYACASLVGAVSCTLLWRVLPEYAAMSISMALVVIIRLLAAHYRWNLPRAKDVE